VLNHSVGGGNLIGFAEAIWGMAEITWRRAREQLQVIDRMEEGKVQE
jgi:hypothetical protein